MHKKLPKIFIFTDEYNTQIFKNKNINIGVIYRNYNSKNREKDLVKICKACRKNRYQLFISNDLKLAYKYKADGIYVPSFNKSKKFLNLEKKNLRVIGSAHSQIEIHNKTEQNCKAIFISPIFHVQKSKNYLYLHKLNYLSLSNKNNFLALGGISESNIRKLKLLSIKGFGGISLFKKKTGLKEAGFYKE